MHYFISTYIIVMLSTKWILLIINKNKAVQYEKALEEKNSVKYSVDFLLLPAPLKNWSRIEI